MIAIMLDMEGKNAMAERPIKMVKTHERTFFVPFIERPLFYTAQSSGFLFWLAQICAEINELEISEKYSNIYTLTRWENNPIIKNRKKIRKNINRIEKT